MRRRGSGVVLVSLLNEMLEPRLVDTPIGGIPLGVSIAGFVAVRSGVHAAAFQCTGRWFFLRISFRELIFGRVVASVKA